MVVLSIKIFRIECVSSGLRSVKVEVYTYIILILMKDSSQDQVANLMKLHSRLNENVYYRYVLSSYMNIDSLLYRAQV